MTQSKNGSYTTLNRLLPRHQKIKQLVALGHSPAKIASELNMTLRQVYNIQNSPSFQHELAILQNSVETDITETLQKQVTTVSEILINSTRAAAEKLGALISSDDESIALRSAQDVLDRGGYPKITKSDNTNRSEVIIDADTAIVIKESLEMCGDTLNSTGFKGSGNGTKTAVPASSEDKPDTPKADSHSGTSHPDKIPSSEA